MIIKFSERLYAEMNKELALIAMDEENNAVKRYERSVQVCIKYFTRLKVFYKDHPVPFGEQGDLLKKAMEAEINFYRHVKPKFKAQLIYFQTLLNMEVRKPVGDLTVQVGFYQSELRGLGYFNEVNLSFCQYIRRQCVHMDELYFCKGVYHVNLDCDADVVDFDPEFNTSHDGKLAQLMANELLQEYLEKQLHRLNFRMVGAESAGMALEDEDDFKWEKAKCALVELIYCWWLTEAFGKKSIKKITAFAQKAFGVELGNVYDTFDWLCGRDNPASYQDEAKLLFMAHINAKYKLKLKNG